MFLGNLLKHNPSLAHTSLKLIHDGDISPNTFVIDLATLSENAKLISQNAKGAGIQIYWMMKQIGNNPLVAKHLISNFGGSLVVVDYTSAMRFASKGIKVGHIGHLVQTPRHAIPSILAMNPEVITVFSMAKLQEIDIASKSMGVCQDILVRVYSRGDDFYQLQGGGIHIDSLPAFLRSTLVLKNIRIVGFTSFPCLLFDTVTHTANLTSHSLAVQRGAQIARELGFNITQLNMPSLSTLDTISILKGAGATHIEPGHAITGTTPLDMDNTLDTAIRPAIAYATEVSHQYQGESYLYAGGYYPRGGLSHAYISGDGDLSASSGAIVATNMVDGMIDYYIPAQGSLPVGSSAIMLFRMQVFTSRGEVVVVEDASATTPLVLGRYTSQGEAIL